MQPFKWLPTGWGLSTQTFNLSDEPRLRTLRLELRLPKRTSERRLSFQTSFLSNNERAELFEKLDEKGHLPEEDVQYLNKRMRESIKQTMDDFIREFLELLNFSSKDSPEEINAKDEFATEVYEWLELLFSWVLQKLKEIFKIEDNKLKKKLICKLFDRLEKSL